MSSTIAKQSHSSRTPIKVVLIGGEAVGKSSIVKRFVKDTFEPGAEPKTAGAGFFSHTASIHVEMVTFHIWDTAGDKRFRPLTSLYYRGADVLVVCFDVTNRSSFLSDATDFCHVLNRSQYHKQQPGKGAKAPVIFIVGCKCEDSANRAVTTREAQAFAAEKGLLYTETSAKTGEGICDLFEKVAYMSGLPLRIAAASSQRAGCVKLPACGEIIPQKGKKNRNKGKKGLSADGTSLPCTPTSVTSSPGLTPTTTLKSFGDSFPADEGNNKLESGCAIS